MARPLQLLFCVFLFLVGCKHEEPNPENLDPIYSDLVKLRTDDEAKLATEKKALVAAQEALVNAEPNTIDLKNAKRDVNRSKSVIAHLEQKFLYDKIRSDRRLAEDRMSYHQAFVAGKEWPDKSEYAEYLVNQRLLGVPRDWDAHLPKLFERRPAAKDAKKKEPAAE